MLKKNQAKGNDTQHHLYNVGMDFVIIRVSPGHCKATVKYHGKPMERLLVLSCCRKRALLNETQTA